MYELVYATSTMRVKQTSLRDHARLCLWCLTLHSADLDQAGCFDTVFAGCQGVCHVSHVSDYDDDEYLRGVCAHVIDSVNRSNSVNRVIVTSSIAAIISEADLKELVRRPVFYEDRYPDEASPKRHTGTRARLLHWQSHAGANVHRSCGGQWQLGLHSHLPCRTTSDPCFRPIKKKKVLGNITSK